MAGSLENVECSSLFVNYEKLKEYRDFGGIRLEDDLIVTESGCKIIGDKTIPITVEDVEAMVGKA